MSELKQLMEIDWWYIVISLCILLVVIKFIWTLLDWLLFDKLGIETKKMKQHREDRELLEETNRLATATAKNLVELQERCTKDEEEFRSNLTSYMEESRKDRKALHDEMTKFTDNRINDRKQSLEIQRELKESIASRDVRNDSLIVAIKEMLAEKINEKYKYYINIKGIPEDEYDEFVSLHDAYNRVGGNHHGDAKFQYCIKHLPIIPVETKLAYKDE